MSETTLPPAATPTRAGIIINQQQMETTTFFANSADIYLQVGNSDHLPNTITFKSNGSLIDGQAIPDVTVIMAGASGYRFGPFPPEIFNNADGLVEIELERPHGTRGSTLYLKPDPNFYRKGINPWQS